MGAVEQEQSISSHTVLMSTPDTHACAHVACARVGHRACVCVRV